MRRITWFLSGFSAGLWVARRGEAIRGDIRSRGALGNAQWLADQLLRMLNRAAKGDR